MPVQHASVGQLPAAARVERRAREHDTAGVCVDHVSFQNKNLGIVVTEQT